jgi:hypothetical protein
LAFGGGVRIPRLWLGVEFGVNRNFDLLLGLELYSSSPFVVKERHAHPVKR